MNVVEKKLADLRPYENNPRFNEDAVPVVEASIREFGFKVPIVVDKDGVIVAGHTRYEAARRIGLETVPCIVADDLTPEQVRAFRLADNKTAEFSGWDWDLLDNELTELSESFNMEDFGFEAIDSESLLAGIEANSVTEDSTEKICDQQLFFLNLKLPRVHKKRVELYRKKNGDKAFVSAVLSICGIEEESESAKD